MAETTIEWTDATWNPVRGCVKVSPGCKHCYAETFAERWRGIVGHPYEQGFDPRLVPEALRLPLEWAKPRRVFVNSMSDLFGEFVPDEYIAAVFGVMLAAERHTFQVLTKRAERMLAWFRGIGDVGWAERVCGAAAAALIPVGAPDNSWPDHVWPPRNVHLGVSVEDRKYGLPRIERLRKTPAALRFLSVEPLLEDLGELDLTGIGWVIVGGESGPGARPCDVAAVRSVVRQAQAQRVPVFVKQLGRVPMVEGKRLRLYAGGVKPDTKGKDLTQWPRDLQVREFPR